MHLALPSFVRLAVAALLAFGLAGAAAAETVKVGCVEFPPLTYSDVDGRAIGSAVDLISDILKRAAVPFEVKCYPGARLLAGLRDGSTHVAILIRHPELADTVQYGTLPVAYLDLRAYRLAVTPPLGDIRNSRGKSVIVLRGYGYGGWIDFFRDPDNHLALSYADSRQAAIRMLASGHGDYLLDYADPATPALAQASLPDLRSEALARLDTYFLVSKKAPGAAALLRRIEDIFARMGAKPVN